MIELASHHLFLLPASLVLGLIIGSFLNVVIHRLPLMMERRWREEAQAFLASDAQEHRTEPASNEPYDLVRPGSSCPHCGHKLSWHENIPLLSYLMLRGRCRSCGSRISPMYPLVELMTGLLTLCVIWQFGLSLTGLAALLLTWSLITLSIIDLRTTLLPDAITLPLLWIGLIINLSGMFTDVQSSVLGAVAGYTSLWLVYHAFRLLTGKEGMGYGDFKLFALLGAWLGWQMLPMIILIASVCGALVGMALILSGRRQAQSLIPFGPYLAAAGLIALFWGEAILHHYFLLLS